MQCVNCNQSLSTEEKFCSACGNKVITKRLTLKSVLADFSQQFFNYDNKLLITFWHLICKPEVVIDGFIQGNRRKYVNVIGYLTLSLTFAGLQIFITQKFFPESMDSFAPESPGENVEYNFNLDVEGFMDYYGMFMILFLPFAAFGTFAVLFKRRHNYAEHIILNMYLTAQYTIMMFFLTVIGLVFNVNTIGLLIFVSLISYTYVGYGLKRLYNLSVLGTIWRTIVSQLIIMVIIFIIMIILAMIIFIIIKAF